MAAQFRYSRQTGRVLLRIKKALENPAKLLKQIGYILLEDSQRAFDNQAFGEIKWPPRYPRQTSLYANIAGIVRDFSMGKKRPPKRRFENRPAGLDTGVLRRSLQSAAKAIGVSGYTVSVGSTVEHAGRFHAGGITRQPITQGIKDLLGKFLRTKFGKQYRPRLGWLFSKKTLVTKLNPRPIVGITDKAEMRIVQTIQDFLAPPQTGGATSVRA